MRKKVETLAHSFTVIGVMAAIIFSGVQLIIYREDSLLRNRPYIEIEFPPDVVEQLGIKVLGKDIIIRRKELFVWVSLNNERKEIEIRSAFSLANRGQYPARIKNISMIFSDVDKTFTLHSPICPFTHKYFIFQNQPMPIEMQITLNRESSEPDAPEYSEHFDKIFSKVEEWLKDENFVLKILVEYTMFNDTKNQYQFKTEKVFQISPGGRDAYNIDYIME